MKTIREELERINKLNEDLPKDSLFKYEFNFNAYIFNLIREEQLKGEKEMRNDK